jgi:hypothetical protein
MKATVRFIRHGGIYRSDVSSHLQTRAEVPRSGRVRPQPKGRAGSLHALLIVATSSDRLFLNGVLASRARLRFTGTLILNPFRDRAQ